MARDRLEETTDLLCPTCLTPIPSGAHFCAKCTAPLTTHATTDPIKRIWASGHLYRTGIRSPRSRLVFVGFWLLFGSAFLMNLLPLYATAIQLLSKIWPIQGVLPRHGVVPLLGLLLFVLVIEAIFAAGLYQVTRNYLTERNGQPRQRWDR